MIKGNKRLDLEHYLEFTNAPEASKRASLMMNACRRHALEAVG